MTDTSAWKVNDKAWMKQRRENWKHIKKKLDKLKRDSTIDIRKDDLQFLKSFYLTGEIDAEAHSDLMWEQYDPKRPLRYVFVSKAVLFECWLSADQSDENWQRIKHNYSVISDEYWIGSRSAFSYLMDVIIKYPVLWTLEGKPFFGGIEKRLFHYFGCPVTGRLETPVNFQITSYFNSPYPDLYYPILDRLEEFRQSVNAWQNEEAHKTVIKAVRIILNSPSNWPNCYVTFAKEVLDILCDPELPKEVTEKVDRIYEVPLPLEELAIPGSKATYYVVFLDEKSREKAYSYLSARGIESKGVDLGEYQAFNFLCPFRIPHFVRKYDDSSLLFQFDMRIQAMNEAEGLIDPFDDGKTSLYAFFSSDSEHDGYYRVLKDDREDGPYRIFVKIEPLYKIGEDVELDVRIASFDDPGEALPLVVEAKHSSSN